MGGVLCHGTIFSWKHFRGDGEGIFEYSKEARDILRECLFIRVKMESQDTQCGIRITS